MAIRMQASSGRTNRQTDHRAAHTDPYIYGTAAPQPKPQIAPRPGRRPGKPTSSQSVRHNRRIHRNQERALYMDPPYVTILTITSVSTLCLCINYLHMQSSTTARMHNIEKMEAQLEQLRAGNDTLETSINTNINLNKIYEIAARELGMVYVKKDQILLYDKAESECIRQYEDIPER